MTAQRHIFSAKTSTPIDLRLPKRPAQQIVMQADCSAVCATALIDTPTGTTPAGRLKAGDLLRTACGNSLAIRWIGHAHVSAQELSRSPSLRPVQLRRNGLQKGQPDENLHLAPATGLVAAGPQGRALVSAADLVAMGGAIQCLPRGGIVYVQILLERHAILRANGVEIESFDPTILRRDRRCAAQLAGILAQMPDLEHGLELYGPSILPALDWQNPM